MKIGLRMAAVVAGVVLAMAVAACDSTTEGQPTTDDPTSTSSNEEPDDGSTSEEPTSSGSPSFSNTQLCGLLTSEEAQQLGGSPTGEAGYSISDGHPQCQWSADTGLTIGFQDGSQVGDGPSGAGITNTPITVAGVEALQSLAVEPNREFCQVMVNLSDDSMMAAGASVRDGGEGKYTPCDVAKQFAEIVIPKAMDR